jgi:hypothetical protein
MLLYNKLNGACRGRHYCLIAILLVSAIATAGGAADFKVVYKTIETEDLRLAYYDSAHHYILPHLAHCFENSFAFHKKLFRYEPSGKVTISFQDFDDYGYAGTTTIPFNYITLGIEPFEYVYDTCPTNERMNWVTNHELVHVVASDQATRGDRFYRRLFLGKVAPTDEDPVSIFYSFLTNPRRYAPRWYHEGIAVFLETWMAGGIGRVLTGWDEMVFRTMVRDGSYFYEPVGLQSEGTAIDFQIGQVAYLYGTRFDAYLAYRYGPEKLIDWVRREDGSCRYYASQFKKVYGASLDDEWARWIDFEREWQRANLDSIRAYPVTPARVLSRQPLGSVSRSFFDPASRTLYTAVNYPGEFSYIAALDIDRGTLRKLCEIPTPALYYVCSLAYDDSSRTLFFTTDNSRTYRDLNAYYLDTGETKLLFKNCRTGDLAVNRADRSLWGVQHHNGFSSLVRFEPPYENGREILRLAYGRDIFDIDVSPDGKYLSGTIAEINGDQRLVRMETANLLVWDSSYEVLWEFENNPAATFVFSPDGRSLVGTSYQTGVSNVFRYDFEPGIMKCVSNAETGLFRPLAVSADSIIAMSFTGKGFVPVMIPNAPIEDVAPVKYLGQAVVESHPVVREWKLGSPLAVNLDSIAVGPARFSALRNTRFTSLIPIAEGYKTTAAFGLRADFMDPLWHNGFNATVSYSPAAELPDDERFHAKLKYENWRWTLRGTYNKADFYDFFGPTRVSRKGYSLGVQFKGYPVSDGPKSLQYTLGVSGFWGLERMPLYQNVATTYDQFYSQSASLNYRRLRGTIGSVEAEKGALWSLNVDNTYVRTVNYPSFYATLDVGALLPIDHSSIWLRTAAGYSFGKREEPFANFYFGGFGNNWIDHAATVNRYREHYSFPGAELNAIGGTNFGKALLEWTLPPVRFKRIGIPSLYANWMRLALFASGIATDMESGEHRRTIGNGGAQINAKIVLFSSLESTFSVGYARAFERGAETTDELMVSLKILR